MKGARTDSSDEHSKSDKHFASAFRDLESEVCDLDRLSEIADLLVMEWMETSGSPPPRQAELAVCAVQQLYRLLQQFKTKYYGTFEGDKAVQS